MRRQQDQQMDRLAGSMALQMVAYFQRQRRVVLEKWKSARIRERVNKGIHVSVNDILDIPTWDNQLLADAKTWLTAVMVDGRHSVTQITGTKDHEEDDEEAILLLSRSLMAGLARFTEINRTTRRQIEKQIEKGRAAGKSVDDIAEGIEKVFSDAVKVRAKMIANNTVVFGVNEGQMIGANKEGYRYKVWLSMEDAKVRPTHVRTDGQARPISEPFLVGGYRMMHPGDPSGSIKETANCRCTMLFTNEPNQAAMLEFGIPQTLV
jgi:hypothetical protein